MNEEKTQQETALIAGFMGLSFDPAKKDEARFYTSKEMGGWVSKSYCNPQYHSSWDWLMPVVSRIEAFGYKFQICRKRVAIMEDSGAQPHVLTVKEGTKKQSVYKAIVDFVTWHNKQLTGK